jgi:hypothetical protein
VIPDVSTAVLAVIIAVSFASGVVVGVVLARSSLRAQRLSPEKTARADRAHWQMPSAALLRPMPASRSRRLVLGGLFCYLVVSVALLLTKSIELGIGHK